MLYAFRGWIAFVAFMDLGTAVRSYIEKRSFLSKTLSDIDYADGKCVIKRSASFRSCFFFLWFRGIHNLEDYRHLLYPKGTSFNTLHPLHTLQTVSTQLHRMVCTV